MRPLIRAVLLTFVALVVMIISITGAVAIGFLFSYTAGLIILVVGSCVVLYILKFLIPKALPMPKWE